jgi:hypothetical protein
MKLTTKKALRALAVSLSRESFFADEETRSMTNVISWLRSELIRSEGSIRRLDAETCVDHVAQLRGEHLEGVIDPIEETAGFLLASLSFGRIAPVSDFTGLLSHLADLTQRLKPRLLVTEALWALSDLAPGGLACVRRYGVVTTREALGLEYGLSSAWLGTAALAPLLSSEVLEGRVLSGANQLFDHESGEIDGDVSSSFIAALAYGRSPQDDAEQKELLDALSVNARPIALFAPGILKCMSLLESYVRDNAADEGAARLLSALKGGRAVSDDEKSAQETLREHLYLELCKRGSLACAGVSPSENLGRLSNVLGQAELYANDFSGHLPLWRLVREEGVKRPRTKSSGQLDGVVGSFTDGLALLESLANDGVLPPRGGLDLTTIRRLEYAFGVTYNTDFIEHAAAFGYERSRLSTNEQHLRDVLIGLSPGYCTGVESQYRHREVVRQPFDFFCHVDDYDVLLEAHGQQHFLGGNIYDPKECRKRDRKKAESLRKADKGNLMLVVLHHRNLSGPAAERIQGVQLVALVDLAVGVDAWWIYARPQGSDDMAAGPRGSSPLAVPSDVAGNALSGLDVFVLKR